MRIPNLRLASSSALGSCADTEALNDASALVVHTEWDCYRHPDFEKVKSNMRKPVVIDGRNLYDPTWLASKGLEYYSVASSETKP